MRIRDRPTAPRSPWQNGYCERAIGSIRRECLDHVVVFGERHLRRLLRSYATYDNAARTHLSVNKDAPLPRTIHVVGPHFAHAISRRTPSSVYTCLIFDKHRYVSHCVAASVASFLGAAATQSTADSSES
jgi:hypothetical protein